MFSLMEVKAYGRSGLCVTRCVIRYNMALVVKCDGCAYDVDEGVTAALFRVSVRQAVTIYRVDILRRVLVRNGQ